jgi:hypothetical protein
LQDDNETQGGYVTRILYQGTWNSDQINQNGYLMNNSGRFLGMVTMVQINQIRCIFQIYETEYIDTPTIEAYIDVDIDKENPSKFKKKDKVNLNHRKSLFSSEKKQQCEILFDFNLMDKNNQPIPFTSNAISKVFLNGSVKSKDCGIYFTFDSSMSSPELLKAFFFTLIQVVFSIMGIFPLYKMLKQNNMNKILIFNEWAFLFNIMIDLIITVINLTFSMKILVEYFEFLTVVTMFMMFSILFKLRFYLYANEIRTANTQFTPQQRTRSKFLFMLKFVFFCIVAIGIGNFLIVYEFIFYIFFAYPLFQVIFNFHGVTQKNCFLWDVHLPFIISQIFYPIFMKGLSFSFFNLTPVKYFPIIIIAEIFIGLVILLLQKCFGACFFLPKCMIPNYFNYFKKFSSHPVEEGDSCPICFSALTENPDDEEEDVELDLKKRPLLPKKYMQTPCGHRFHEDCLKNWMEQKLVCPCCRSSIPPVI